MKKTSENLEILKKFVLYVKFQLDIKTNVEFEFLEGKDANYPSAGGYVLGNSLIAVSIKNRAIADVLRTLAHELTHHKQFELGILTPKDTDNQELEDQANVYSGRLVRWFGRENPEIYQDLN